MRANNMHLYGKFKMHKNPNIMKEFFISENEDKISRWKGITQEDSHSYKEDENDIQADVFANIQIELERSLRVFENTIPYLTSRLPLLLNYLDDRQIRGYFVKHGDVISNDEYEVYKISISHINQISKLISNSASLHKGISQLPTMFFMGLVSAYDAFLAQFIRAIFIVRPELLSASEQTFTFKDLMEIDSIDAARDRMIERQVENVLRSSHADQIKWLENKLNMTLTRDLEIWSNFVELFERRNLIAHTGGVVSSQYIATCKNHKVKINNLKIGDKIRINRAYYKNSVKTILEFGIKLVQVIWRKLYPDNIELADQELNRFCYDLIIKEDYDLASRLLSFRLNTLKKAGKEADRKRMVVNIANARKLSGHWDEAIEILAKEDWSAATLDFSVCIAAIKREHDQVIDNMQKVVDMEYMDATSFRGWPVFNEIRSDSRFSEKFEQIFGEPLLIDVEESNFPD